MTPKKSENTICLSEYWPLLWRVWQLGCARVGCLFWLSEKPLSVEISGGVMNLWLILMDIGCTVYDMVYLSKNLWISEHAWHFKSQLACGSLVSITWSGIGNGIGITGCYWWGFGTCGIGWGWEWLDGWGQEVGHVIHAWHKPISIINNHKFTIPSSISTLGDFSLSQNGQPILAQPNFHTLNKSGQCSPKHKLFSDFVVSYDRWDL